MQTSEFDTVVHQRMFDEPDTDNHGTMESFTFTGSHVNLTTGNAKFVDCKFENTTIVSPRPLSVWSRVRLWWHTTRINPWNG